MCCWHVFGTGEFILRCGPLETPEMVPRAKAAELYYQLPDGACSRLARVSMQRAIHIKNHFLPRPWFAAAAVVNIVSVRTWARPEVEGESGLRAPTSLLRRGFRAHSYHVERQYSINVTKQ